MTSELMEMLISSENICTDTPGDPVCQVIWASFSPINWFNEISLHNHNHGSQSSPSSPSSAIIIITYCKGKHGWSCFAEQVTKWKEEKYMCLGFWRLSNCKSVSTTSCCLSKSCVQLEESIPHFSSVFFPCKQEAEEWK